MTAPTPEQVREACVHIVEGAEVKRHFGHGYVGEDDGYGTLAAVVADLRSLDLSTLGGPAQHATDCASWRESLPPPPCDCAIAGPEEDEAAIRADLQSMVEEQEARATSAESERDALRAQLAEARAEADSYREAHARDVEPMRQARNAARDEAEQLRAQVAALKGRRWVQCTSVSNDCLGGCASMREHDAYRLGQMRAQVVTLVEERDRMLARIATKDAALARIDSGSCIEGNTRYICLKMYGEGNLCSSCEAFVALTTPEEKP